MLQSSYSEGVGFIDSRRALSKTGSLFLLLLLNDLWLIESFNTTTNGSILTIYDNCLYNRY